MTVPEWTTIFFPWKCWRKKYIFKLKGLGFALIVRRVTSYQADLNLLLVETLVFKIIKVLHAFNRPFFWHLEPLELTVTQSPAMRRTECGISTEIWCSFCPSDPETGWYPVAGGPAGSSDGGGAPECLRSSEEPCLWKSQRWQQDCPEELRRNPSASASAEENLWRGHSGAGYR